MPVDDLSMPLTRVTDLLPSISTEDKGSSAPGATSQPTTSPTAAPVPSGNPAVSSTTLQRAAKPGAAGDLKGTQSVSVSWQVDASVATLQRSDGSHVESVEAKASFTLPLDSKNKLFGEVVDRENWRTSAKGVTTLGNNVSAKLGVSHTQKLSSGPSIKLTTSLAATGQINTSEITPPSWAVGGEAKAKVSIGMTKELSFVMEGTGAVSANFLPEKPDTVIGKLTGFGGLEYSDSRVSGKLGVEGSESFNLNGTGNAPDATLIGKAELAVNLGSSNRTQLVVKGEYGQDETWGASLGVRFNGL